MIIELISRKALEEDLEQHYDEFTCLNDYNLFLKIVDNQPVLETWIKKERSNQNE